MPIAMKNAPALGGETGATPELNYYGGEQTMSIFTDDYSERYFDAALTVGARLAGGDLQLTPEHVAWLGETTVRVEMPGHVLVLHTYEARDLARALLNSAAHIDEEYTVLVEAVIA